MTIEEALAASEAEPVTDDDMQFWIDEHLRVISIPKNGVVAGVEGDKNVNKIKFRMNRYYHGFDMSEFSGRILYSNAKCNKNYYNITDMQTSGNTITFSWLVDADAVQYMGKTAFVVYLFKTQGSELRQKFYSTLATLNVLEGMEVDSAVPVEKQTDIIERMKEEISAYAEEVKKSLPADYTAMTEQVSSLKDDLNDLKEEILAGGVAGGSGFSQPFKTALSNFMDGVAFVSDNGQALKNAVLDAMVITSDGGGTDTPSTPDEPVNPPSSEPVVVNLADVSDLVGENCSMAGAYNNGGMVYRIEDVRVGDVLEITAGWNTSVTNEAFTPRYSESIIENYGTGGGKVVGTIIPESDLEFTLDAGYSHGHYTLRPSQNYPYVYFMLSYESRRTSTWEKVRS